ncbi:hypothetical protein Q8F55_005665 [Vanrija albida]|uniref:Zn(2)-C6 fungal-type domain-containing protein n=1 Tax=Vanrija albida TaxID=181172 RepID=A0ABR3Q2A4_9TREE
MRCIGALDPPCRRCRRTGATCEFVARRNAAVPLSPGPYPSHTCTELWRNDVTERLKTLEATNARLEGLLARMDAFDRGGEGRPGPSRTAHIPTPQSDPPGALGLSVPASSAVPPEFRGVWDALDRLKHELPASLAASDAWALPAVCQLYDS